MQDPPSPYPMYDSSTGLLHDGSSVRACVFCRNALATKPECKNHYARLNELREGYYQCPFGFTSRSFRFLGKLWVITGTVAHPRFGSGNERQQAKDFPAVRSSRPDIDAVVRFFGKLENLQAEVIQQSAKVLPQAFHELRKLNSAVLQHAERERKTTDSPNLVTIISAAELMRNNFDILEAISNIEGMRAVPRDSTVDLFGLVYKVKKVYEVRALEKQMRINVTGDMLSTYILGSQKSFPLVPQVLMENAIKYGVPDSLISVQVSTKGSNAVLTVGNRSRYYIDAARCFERGARYAPDVEGGGFGLFLAREIVLCHRGTIHCEAGNGLVRMVVTVPAQVSSSGGMNGARTM